MKTAYKVLLLVSAVIFTFMSVELNAQGSTPIQSEPDSASVCNARQVVFRWSIVPNALDYRLQISKVSGSYVDAEYDIENITNTNDIVELSDNSATYYWRVGARFSSTINYSNEWVLKTKAAPPVVLSPEDQSECVENQVDLTWEAAQDAESYNVQVSTNLNFTSFAHDLKGISSTQTSVDLVNGFTTYYWRVSYNYDDEGSACVSEWSTPFQLKTKVAAPEVTEPSDNEQGVAFDKDIRWNFAEGATSYDLQISPSNTFGDLAVNEIGLTSNLHSVTFPEIYNQEYFLRMRSDVSGTCTSEWSDVISFKTPYEQTVLVSPEFMSDCYPVSDVTFDWDPVPGALQYRIKISDEPDFSNIVFDTDSIETDEITFDMPGDITTYYWIVRAEDSTNVGIWSDTSYFETGVFDPILTSPANDAAEVFINTDLQWTSESNFSQFRIQLSPESEFLEDSLLLDETGINDLNYEIILPYYSHRYYWRVSSTFGDCVSNWSDVSSFISMRGYPDLVAPEDMATDVATNLNLSWDEVEGAVSYDIEISNENDFDVLEFGRLGIQENNISVNLKPETEYYWRVRTNTGYSKSPWSSVYSFSTGVAPAGIPQLSYPSDRSQMVASDVTLEWLPQDGADSYNLQISTDNDFNDLVIEESEIEDTLYANSDLENYETYYWRVQAVNQSGATSWSTAWRFRVVAPTIENAVVLSAPENEATDLDIRAVYLKWFAQDEAEEYDGGYQLQFGLAEDFNTDDLLIDSRNVWDAERQVNDLDDNTTYWWRVRGWNEAGDGPWSEGWSFTTKDLSSINAPEFLNGIELYPNPVEDQFNVEMNVTKSSLVSIDVYDVSGNKIANVFDAVLASGKQNIKIEGLDLVSGTYFVYIRSGNGASVKQIVVNK